MNLQVLVWGFVGVDRGVFGGGLGCLGFGWYSGGVLGLFG